jgi:hypothetical protein
MTELCTYISTHNTAAEGGHKTHIGIYDDGKPLCGRRNVNYHCTFPDNGICANYIMVGIRSKEVCVKCAEKAFKLMIKELKK